jgi:hypothetical protein
MIRSILLVGLLLSYTLGYSNVSKPNWNRIGHLIKKMERQKYLMHNYKITPRNIRYANKLHKIATEEELINLTSHPHHVPFCLAFLVLSKRNSPAADSIFQAFNLPILEAFERGESYYAVREINIITKNNPSCILVLMNDYSFLGEVKLQRKYVDLIK